MGFATIAWLQLLPRPLPHLYIQNQDPIDDITPPRSAASLRHPLNHNSLSGADPEERLSSCPLQCRRLLCHGTDLSVTVAASAPAGTSFYLDIFLSQANKPTHYLYIHLLSGSQNTGKMKVGNESEKVLMTHVKMPQQNQFFQ